MMQSVNFRLGDAMPNEVMDKWKAELGLPVGCASFQPARAFPDAGNLAGKVARTPGSAPMRTQLEIELRRRIEKYLDSGHGACWLRQPDIAALVEGALRHFDGERYRLLAWCIMPNHVHVLIETKEGFPLGSVLHSWKSFTSGEANKLLGRRGEFWQREYLDRYVRNAEHYAAVIAYIEGNPVNAGLARLKTEWSWSSARFRAGSAGFQPASSY